MAERLQADETRPDPVIEAYKKDIDRTLLRERLTRTVEERFRDLMGMHAFFDEAQRVRRARQ
ncbi:MAG: hypothetical protein H0X44_08775 [Acidobacteria bacterium]|nr:hypothetical protein [Acidobacteriota bacterium]